MGILYLTGDRLKNAVVAAAQRILDVQERLNSINVFPIPDGDTGTNMALTMKMVADGAINSEKRGLASMSSNLAEAALMGAQGNSGAILAQFFQGLADSYRDLDKVDLKGFAASAIRAVTYAEQAIANPSEGTILTVMRDWANHIQDQWHKAADFAHLLKDSFQTASKSLRETPEKLKVLAMAGVVDAGAQGFVDMLEGVNHYMDTGVVAWQPDSSEKTATETPPAVADLSQQEQEIPFRFCTECLLLGTQLDLAKIRETAAPFGNSMVVAGNTNKAKVHIHTNDPERLFQTLESLGTVTKTKADDMKAQYQHRHGSSDTPAIALITDSSCDLPQDWLIKHGIRVVPVNLTLGEKTYLDRVDITSKEVYRIMKTSGILPTTSQPSPGSYQRVYKMAAEHHEQGIALFLSSQVSGTYQAGVLASKQQDQMKMEVVDAKTTAGAMGMLVRVAAEAIAEGCSLAQVRTRVETAQPYAKIVVAFRSIDNLIRSGRVSKLKGFLARGLNLLPLLTFAPDGKVKSLGKAKPGKKSWKKTLDYVIRDAETLQKPSFAISHAAEPEGADFLAQGLKSHFNLDQVDILEVSPTLGALVGLGTVAISYIGFPPGRESWA